MDCQAKTRTGKRCQRKAYKQVNGIWLCPSHLLRTPYLKSSPKRRQKKMKVVILGNSPLMRELYQMLDFDLVSLDDDFDFAIIVPKKSSDIEKFYEQLIDESLVKSKVIIVSEPVEMETNPDFPIRFISKQDLFS